MSEEQKRPPEGREENLSGGDAFKVDLYFWLQALVMALVSLILLFTFVGRVIGVQGSSMVPTLHDKDMLLLHLPQFVFHFFPFCNKHRRTH